MPIENPHAALSPTMEEGHAPRNGSFSFKAIPFSSGDIPCEIETDKATRSSKGRGTKAPSANP